MRRNAGSIVFAVAVGYALAHFATAFYNHWYFADWFWLKVGLATPVIALAFGAALMTEWRIVWRIAGVWWILTHLLAMVPAGGPDLRGLAFVAVLDFEVAVVWVPGGLLVAYWLYRAIERRARERREAGRTDEELKMRRRLRERTLRRQPRPAAVVSQVEAGNGE